MEERIIKLITALRAAGVRISLAESTDAILAVDRLGVKDREIFKLSLQTTLIKDSANLPVFEELFEIFFGSLVAPPMINLGEDLTTEEAQQLAEVLRELRDEIREMIERIFKGEKLTADELERLGKMVGLNQMDEMRYREWMVQRLKKALRFKEVQEALQELLESLADLGMDKERVEQMYRLIQANQKSLEDQLRQFAGQRIAENMSQRSEREGVDRLLNRPLNSLTDADMERLRKEVQRLAAALKTRIALRQKRSKSGQLDAKATIRANLRHNNVPIELKHRERTLKPKLVVLCDVSTSMRFCSELMLSLIYALQDQITKTYAFAFIDHLEYISPDFEGYQPSQAVARVLDRMPSGFYNTDLGNSLLDFNKTYLNTVDSRTTFIIVGDGRNNYNDPRLDLMNLVSRRSKRTIWLNPESPLLWGTGDSDMLKYAASCDVVLQAGTLAELVSTIDKLLLS